MKGESHAPEAQTLRRGLSILMLLARYHPNGLGTSDIGRRLGLNKATAARLTRTLMDETFVTQDPRTRAYRLGPESLAIGLAAAPTYAFQRLAAPAMRSLTLQTNDWVFFSVLEGLECVCVSGEPGHMPAPSDAMKIGDRYPLGFGAGGVAILASLPDDRIKAVLAANAEEITRRCPSQTTSKIWGLIRDTRERGYSVLPGSIVPGYWGLGVPLLQGDNNPKAAIVLATTEMRLSVAREAVLGDRLLRIARQLGQQPQ